MEATMNDTIQRPKHALIASDRIEGTAVRRSNGEKIGKIERLMIDKISGTIGYAVLSFGGLFGLGHHHYPLSWAILKYNPVLDAYECDVTEELLSGSIKVEDTDFGDRVAERVLYERYGAGPYWSGF
jgi:hypothetical protein